MIYNIIIGQDSLVTKSLSKFLKNKIIFSSKKLSIENIKEIKSYKKINLIFKKFYKSKLLNDLTYRNYVNFEKLSIRILANILENIEPKKN